MSGKIRNVGVLRLVDDDFDGFNEAGDDRATRQGPILGAPLKFSAAGKWEVANNGEVIGSDTLLVVVNAQKALARWNSTQRVELRIIPPGEPFPDVDGMNEAAPRVERTRGMNALRGPWQKHRYVTLLNPKTLDVYTFSTSAPGPFFAIRELVDRVRIMRRHHGPSMSPLVKLADAPMKTRYGIGRRPYFKITAWVGVGSDGKRLLLSASGAIEPAATDAPATGPKETDDESQG